MWRVEQIRDENGCVRTRRVYDGGSLIQEMHYAADYYSPRGVAREWYRTGELRRQRCFNDEGHVEGADETWWPDGSPRSIRTRVNRRNHGTERRWYRDGTPRVIGQWAEGERTGPWRWYRPDGHIRLEVDFERGRPHGEIRLWARDGQLTYAGRAEHGAAIDPWRVGGPAWGEGDATAPGPRGRWLVQDERTTDRGYPLPGDGPFGRGTLSLRRSWTQAAAVLGFGCAPSQADVRRYTHRPSV
jgi:antitoxin component YwqK of YwqJK toxin-antitoxin module